MLHYSVSRNIDYHRSTTIKFMRFIERFGATFSLHPCDLVALQHGPKMKGNEQETVKNPQAQLKHGFGPVQGCFVTKLYSAVV